MISNFQKPDLLISQDRIHFDKSLFDSLSIIMGFSQGVCLGESILIEGDKL